MFRIWTAYRVPGPVPAEPPEWACSTGASSCSTCSPTGRRRSGLCPPPAGGAFRLGPRLTELAAVAGPELDLASLAGPVLDELHRTTRESVQLYVLSGGHRLCIAARDSGTGLRDSVPVGALLPLAAGSGGKVLLAWSDASGDSELTEV